MKTMTNGCLLLLILAIAGYGFPRRVQAAPPADSGTRWVDVRACGAAGNGRSDDTDAFLAAVKLAAAGRKHVYVPGGRYRISRTLELDGIGIEGPGAAAWPSDVDALPSLLPAHRDGPAVRLLAGGSLRGLDISYAWDKPPTTGPAAILLSGIGAWVSNARIRCAWDGIVADGSSNIGRANIENVFMASIANCGVRITGTWDVPRLHNVEVWNAGASESNRALAHGVGFHLGKNDLIRLTDCFVFGMQHGFLLENRIAGCSVEGETWGTMNGCSTDFCGQGITIRGTHTVSASGCSLWNHGSSLVVDGEGARVRIAASELKSNGAPALLVRNCDHTVVTGCSLLRPMEGFTSPSALLEGGRVALGSNCIESHAAGVQIERGIRSVALQGNIIESRSGQPIVDRSLPGRVELSGNITSRTQTGVGR